MQIDAQKKLSDLLNEVGISLPAASAAVEITGICADSRLVQPGNLFVAVVGLAVDGHRFVEQAIVGGCAAVIFESGRLPAVAADGRQPVMIEVTDSQQTLGVLAAAFYGQPASRLKMIGITGTNGKTTTSYLTETMLRHAGFRPGVIGTVNYRYQDARNCQVELPAPHTTPDAPTLHCLLKEMADAGTTHVIMEVSSHALAQQRLAGLEFDVAVFTNLSRDHLDFHGDMAQYFASKKLLFTDHLKTGSHALIVRESSFADQTTGQQGWGERLATELAIEQPDRGHYLTCGLTGPNTIHAERASFDLQGITAEIATPAGTVAIRSPLVGEFNVKNLLTAVGIGFTLGLDSDTISAGLGATTGVPGRLQRVSPSEVDHDGPLVFVDYAHTPEALENVLATLRQCRPRRLICVFGCGGDRDRGKRPIMGEVVGRLSDIAVATSDNPRSEDPTAILAAIEQGLRQSLPTRAAIETLLRKNSKGYDIIPARRQAIRAVISNCRAGDVVLISGKGHENYQIIGSQRHFFDDRIEAGKQLGLRNRPQPAWTLETVLAATGGQVVGAEYLHTDRFRAISTDTRTMRPGDLFVALSGENFDGVAFADEAARKGAAGLLLNRLPDVAPNGAAAWQDVPIILVADPLQALGDLAAFHRLLLAELLVIAITGSSGKTTVKEMTAAIIARKMAAIKTEGNLNNLIGMPLTLLRATADHRAAILEMGMNRPGEIARLAAIAAPDISCITNIQAAHLAGLGSITGVARAKNEIFSGTKPTGTLIVNGDDPMVRAQARQHSHNKIVFAATPAGRRHKPLIRATRIKNLGEHGIAFTLQIGREAGRVRLTAIGRHNVGNALAAAAMSYVAGIGLPDIVAGLEQYRPYTKRAKIERLACGLKVINDSYNANPSSMLAALAALQDVKNEHRTVALLGDMLELGDYSLAAHQNIGTAAARLGCDFLAAYGSYAEAMIEAARAAGLPAARARAFTEKNDMTGWLIKLLGAKEVMAGDWLLIKGSRGMRMESVLEELSKVA